jgi:hypothetical protein
MKRSALLPALLCLVLMPVTAFGGDPVEDRLKETLVNINFESTPLPEALAFVSQFAGVNIGIDPQVFEKKSEEELLVTLRADDIAVGNVIELIALTKSLAHDVRWGGVFLSTPERLRFLPRSVRTWYARPGRKLARVLAKAVSFEFEETELRSVLDFLRNVANVNIVILPEVMEAAESTLVTLALSEVPLRHALAAILLPRGFTYQVRDGVLLITALPADPAQGWRPAAEKILDEVKLDVVEGGSTVRECLVSLAMDERIPLPVVLDAAMVHGDGGWNAPAAVAGLIWEEPISLRSVLNLLRESHGVAWDLRWEVVFLSSPERLKVLPRDPLPPARDPEPWEAALRRKLAEAVSFTFAATPVQNALEFIQQLLELNIVLDPAARERAQETIVDLEVRDMTVANALALVLLPRGFSMALEHEVLLVRAPK